MVIAKEKLSYIIYFTVVCLIFADFTNSLPLFFAPIVNKLLYVLVLSYVAVNFFKLIKLNKNTLAPLLFLLMYSVFLVVKTVYHGEEVFGGVAVAIFYFFMFFVFISYRQEWSLSKYLRPFLLSTSVILLVSLLVYLGFNIPLYVEDPSVLERYAAARNYSLSHNTAFSGAFLNQNTFGALLLITLISMIFYKSDKANSRFLFKAMYYTLFFLALLFLVKTMSRSSIFGFAVFVIIYLLSQVFRLKGIVYLFFSATLSITILYLAQDYFLKILERTQQGGTSHRVDIWADAYSQFTENMAFGVGNYMYNDWTAHNHFVQVLASDGIFVFLFMILFFLFFIFRSALIFFSNFANTQAFKQKVLFVSSFAAIIFHQMFETMLQSPFSPITLIFFLSLVGLLKGNSFPSYKNTNLTPIKNQPIN